SALGIDLKRLPGNEDFLRALETDTPQASPVKDFTYVEGHGIVLDLPMNLQGKFASLLMARFDTDVFFRQVLGAEFLRKFDISVGADGKAAFNTYASKPADAPWRVRDKMEGALKEWDVSLTPKPEYAEARRSPYPLLALATGLMMAFFAAAGLLRL